MMHSDKPKGLISNLTRQGKEMIALISAAAAIWMMAITAYGVYHKEPLVMTAAAASAATLLYSQLAEASLAKNLLVAIGMACCFALWRRVNKETSKL